MEETVETMVGKKLVWLDLSRSKLDNPIFSKPPQVGTGKYSELVFFANTYLNNDNCGMSYLKRLDVSAAEIKSIRHHGIAQFFVCEAACSVYINPASNFIFLHFCMLTQVQQQHVSQASTV